MGPCDDRGEVDSGSGFGDGSGRRLLMEAAVLASLAGRAAHGYDLRRALAELTGGFMVVESSSIYRLLRRLEQEGLVASSWTEGEYGPQRRQYHLTDDGYSRLVAWRPQLEARERAFRLVIEAISRCAATR
jgi:PadR family transcriptional regulator PadR